MYIMVSSAVHADAANYKYIQIKYCTDGNYEYTLAGWNYKFTHAKIRITNVHLQNGITIRNARTRVGVGN